MFIRIAYYYNIILLIVIHVPLFMYNDILPLSLGGRPRPLLRLVAAEGGAVGVGLPAGLGLALAIEAVNHPLRGDVGQ